MVKNVLSVALCFFLKACVNIRLKDLVNLVHKRRKMVFFNCGKRVCLLKWSANECGKTQQHAYVGATYVWLYCILYDYEYIYIYILVYISKRGASSLQTNTWIPTTRGLGICIAGVPSQWRGKTYCLRPERGLRSLAWSNIGSTPDAEISSWSLPEPFLVSQPISVSLVAFTHTARQTTKSSYLVLVITLYHGM